MSKKILVVSPTPSHPQNAGNSARIYNLLINLRDIGYDTYFAHIKVTPGDKDLMSQCWGNRFFSIPYRKPDTAYAKHPQSIVAKVWVRLRGLLGSDPRYTYAIDDWYDDLIDDAIVEIAKEINPDIVIAEYVFLSKVLENFDPSVLKMIDTHDVFAQRYKLYLKNNQKPRWFSTTRKEERKGLCRADVAIAIQEKEATFFSQLLPASQRIVTLGHLVSLQSVPLQEKNHNILYIGSSNAINVSGLQRFIKEIFPKVKSQVNDAQLILAGGICDQIDGFEGCLKLGRVDNLVAVYARANVAINPVYFGTGLKIKSTEALGYAKPLVTTSVGAEGLEAGAGEAFVVADSADAFARAIADILTNPQRRETLSKNAYQFAEQRNARCLESLAKVIEQRS